MEGSTVVDQPADRADEGPDRVAPRRRASSAVAFNSTMSAAERRGGRGRRSRPASKEFVYTTPEQLANPEFRSLLSRVADRPVRGGRGALREPLGPRLPPRLPRAGHRDRGAGPPDRPGHDGDRHRRGRRRHHPAVPHPRRRDRAHRILSAQPAPGCHLDPRRGPAPRAAGRAARRGVRGSGIIYVATVKAVGELTEFLQAAGLRRRRRTTGG